MKHYNFLSFFNKLQDIIISSPRVNLSQFYSFSQSDKFSYFF